MGEGGITRREMVRRTIGAGTALAAPGLLGASAHPNRNAAQPVSPPRADCGSDPISTSRLASAR